MAQPEFVYIETTEGDIGQRDCVGYTLPFALEAALEEVKAVEKQGWKVLSVTVSNQWDVVRDDSLWHIRLITWEPGGIK